MDAALIALDKADGDEIYLEVLVDLLNACDKSCSAQLEREHRTEDILQYQELLEVTCLDMKPRMLSTCNGPIPGPNVWLPFETCGQTT